MLVGGLVSLVLVAVLLIWVDPAELAVELAHQLRQVNLPLLAVAIGLYFVGVFVRALRWQLILRPLVAVPVHRLFGVMIVGFTVNNLVPARLGEIARAYLLLRSHRVRPAGTLATIMVERVLDGLVLCGFVLAGWLTLPLDPWVTTLGWVGTLGFLAGCVILWFVANPSPSIIVLGRRLRDRLPARVGARLGPLMASFSEGLAIMRQARLLGTCLGLSLAAWLIEASMFYLIAIACGLVVAPFAPILAVGAANLGTMIPALPGYVGTFDFPLIAVMTLFQVERAAATGYTIVVHAALIVPVVIVGLLLIAREGLTLGTVTRPPLPTEPQPSSRIRRDDSDDHLRRVETNTRTLPEVGLGPD